MTSLPPLLMQALTARAIICASDTSSKVYWTNQANAPVLNEDELKSLGAQIETQTLEVRSLAEAHGALEAEVTALEAAPGDAELETMLTEAEQVLSKLDAERTALAAAAAGALGSAASTATCLPSREELEPEMRFYAREWKARPRSGHGPRAQHLGAKGRRLAAGCRGAFSPSSLLFCFVSLRWAAPRTNGTGVHGCCSNNRTSWASRRTWMRA